MADSPIRPPTIEDIAKRIGVSKSAVSLALNNKPGISQKLRQSILETAQEIGYSLPESRQQSSILQRKSIAVVHQIGEEPFNDIYGFFITILNGIRTFTQQANINLTVIGGYRKGDLNRLGEHILNDKNNPLDGLILMGPGVKRESQLLRQTIEKQVPLVVLSRNWPDMPISTVGQDHQQQSQIALDHLIELGHRKIAFLAGIKDQQYDWFDTRLKCYQEKMAQINSEEYDKIIIFDDDGTQAVKQLLAKQPDITAIFAIHDRLAVEVMVELKEHGVKVPEDISVIGLDDSEQIPEGCPELTTVGFPHFDVGYLATELLYKQMNNANIFYSNILVRSKLIKRSSCYALNK
ncbi:MAG: LacI family transcriptional regulator [Chloroflexi bacterium]|nr:MAG: LacI family transcriptional regulator [Chloroflexota bacterium]